MPKGSDDDSPLFQNLRVMTVCRCVPGYADEADTGEPITILTLEFRGEIEQPILLTLRDSRRLAFDLIDSLAYHGDETAAKIERLLAEDA